MNANKSFEWRFVVGATEGFPRMAACVMLATSGFFAAPELRYVRPMCIVLRMLWTGKPLFVNLFNTFCPFRNQQVVGSIPTAGSTKSRNYRFTGSAKAADCIVFV